MTYDPREPVAIQPFDLFPKQAEFIAWLAEREKLQEDGLVEKSRDMGASWLCCAYALHGWLFRPGYQVGFGSRKLEYVDEKGDPKSIFEKLRLLLQYLPGWMIPAGFNWKVHSCHAKLINPANGATITGEGGDNIGRGGRSSVYFVDEYAFLERPQLIDRSLSQTTRVRIDVSTPNGPGNPFAEKRFSGRVPVFTMHWRDDPRKGEAWYEEQKRRFDPVTVAQEIDIDYSASIEGIVIPAKWVRAAVGLDLPASGPIEAGLDIAEYGKDRCVYLHRQGPVVGAIEDWGQCNTHETAYRALDLCTKHGVATLHYDAGGLGAGVRGTLEAIASERDLPFYADGVQSGSSPSGAWWPDGQTSNEKFINLRAELWWLLRCRFEKTYEHVEHGVAHPPEEMISIPNCPQLIAELSQPLCARTETGKIKIESKETMRKRGVKSPDFADALALAFCEGSKPDFNIHHLKLSPEQETPHVAVAITKGFEEFIRHFPQSNGFQPLPVLDGEKVLSCPCFPKQSMAAYFVCKLADDLNRPRPEGLIPAALPEDQREHVDKAVAQIIKERRLTPLAKSEPPPQQQQAPPKQVQPQKSEKVRSV